ncbi:MAG: hypothetical protein SGI88_04820 [Candidatus Hydrogenedentes bacterium]|nr:hypothetical protein [Candidatus Hydrogenedentota bacterium]
MKPSTLLTTVREALPTPTEWLLKGGHARTPFYGKVRGDSFWVMMSKSRWEKNSFNPVLVARITSTTSGSRITATIRLSRPVQIFIGVWLMMALFIGIGGVHNAVSSGMSVDRNVVLIIAVTVPIVLLTVGITAYIVRDINRRRKPALEQWLREISDALPGS